MKWTLCSTFIQRKTASKRIPDRSSFFLRAVGDYGRNLNVKESFAKRHNSCNISLSVGWMCVIWRSWSIVVSRFISAATSCTMSAACAPTM